MKDSPRAKELAKFIDHTLLKPEARAEDIRALCREAREWGFASVCVNGAWASLVSRELEGSGVKTAVVVGFPLGASESSVKAFEAGKAAEDGAAEIDMVLNVGLLKAGEDTLVKRDIAAVRGAVPGACLKVIIETCLLTDEEKERACRLAVSAGADFVKTSTGFSKGGATPEDVALMRRTVGPDIGVKASGGIRTREDAEKMIAAGASRIGASAGVLICGGQK